MVAVANANVIYSELYSTKPTFLSFVIAVTEGLISQDRQHAAVDRKSASSLGRPPTKKAKLFNVLDHLPIEGKTRRRCRRCSSVIEKEKRSTIMYQMCNIPLCKTCFTS